MGERDDLPKPSSMDGLQMQRGIRVSGGIVVAILVYIVASNIPEAMKTSTLAATLLGVLAMALAVGAYYLIFVPPKKDPVS